MPVTGLSVIILPWWACIRHKSGRDGAETFLREARVVESWLKEGKKLLFASSSPIMCSDNTLEAYIGYQVPDFFYCATPGKTGFSTISAVNIELI